MGDPRNENESLTREAFELHRATECSVRDCVEAVRLHAGDRAAQVEHLRSGVRAAMAGSGVTWEYPVGLQR